MLKSGKIFQHLILLFCLIVIGGIFYFLGNTLQQSNYYSLTFLDCIETALIFCIPSYILYLFIYRITKAKKSVLISSGISILSFGIVFLVISFFAPYGADYKSRYVILNMFVFIITALCIPSLEKVILKTRIQ